MKRSFCDRISIKNLPRAIRRRKERKKERRKEDEIYKWRHERFNLIKNCKDR